MNRLAAGIAPAIVLGAAAFRRCGDLGDTVPVWAFVSLLALACVLLAAMAPRSHGATTPAAPLGWMHIVPAAIGLVWMLAIPTATAMAVVAAGAGWALAAAMPADHLRSRVAPRLEFVVFVLLVLVATTWLVDAVSLRRVASPHGAALVAGLLQWFGIAAASSGAHVLLDGPREQQAFLVTANNVGLVPHLTVAVVVVGWRLLGAPGATSVRWLLALGYLATALLLRFTLLMAVGLGLDHASEFDNHDFNLAAMLDWRVGLGIDLIAGIAAAGIWLRSTASQLMPMSAVQPLRPWLLATAALTGVLWSSDRVLDAFGQPDQPARVAVDELHSRWEASDIPLTRDHYGQESGYNFRGLCGWLEGSHGPIRRLYDPMSDAVLADVDVLVVKTPTEAFQAEERAAIDRFVQRGGGLVLIGDHTNVFGTSEVLNSLADPLGFRFVYDCCFDQRRRFEFRYEKERGVRGHPTLAGMDGILFEVGCTIQIDSPRVRPVLVGRSLKSQPIDYGIENYYGKPRDRSEQECGQFPILVTATRGKGRVVAVADSTLFSTFSVFMPGRREIVEGMIAYVSGRDIGESWRDLLWRLAVGLTLLLFPLLLAGKGAHGLVTCSLLAWGAGSLATATVERLAYPGHPDLRQANAPASVAFVQEDGSVEWPTHGFSNEPERCFSLFFQFSTRIGAYPRLVRDRAEAMAAPGPLVWIDPIPSDAATAADEVLAFARNGGTAILMEREPRALVTTVAQRLGLGLADAVADPTGTAVVSRHGRASTGGVPPARGIAGGLPLLRIDNGGPCVATVQDVGAGRIVLVTCGQLFADSRYGYRYGTIPDATLRRLYEVQYSLLQSAFRKRG